MICREGRVDPCAVRRSDGGKSLVDIDNDVVDMLDADRQAHEILGNAGAGELFRVELSVCRRRRMAGERFRVADIDQPQDHLEPVDELCARFLSALDAEVQNAGALSPVYPASTGNRKSPRLNSSPQ